MKGYEPAVSKYLDKLVTRFDEQIGYAGGEEEKAKSAVVDIVEWFNFAMFDIIGEFVWSCLYECLASGTGHAFMGVLLHFQAVLIGASTSYYPGLNAFLMNIKPKLASQMLEIVFVDSRERLQSRMKMDATKHPDLISHIKRYNSQAPASGKHIRR